MNPASNEEVPDDASHRLRSIFGGSVGNLIEWYDFYVFNSFAVYFAKASPQATIPRPSSSPSSVSTRWGSSSVPSAG